MLGPYAVASTCPIQRGTKTYMPANMLGSPVSPFSHIWRFMDFAKFGAMLEGGGLFFSRSDLLGDPFEASLNNYEEEERSRKDSKGNDVFELVHEFRSHQYPSYQRS